ncbi:hypothetical protein [Kordiimonas sp.]|uniref:hypothetical protein n=1 Tax=Kordiimonas sp. TaxID=1970157 RepID=UPI003B524ECC
MAARLALPLGMVTIVGLAMPFFEKAFVAKYLAFQDLSLLAAASKVGMIFALPLQAFQMAWGPLSLATSKDKNPQSFYDLVVKLYLGLGSILLFSLVVSGGYALSILASTEYERAWSMIPLSIAVVYLRGLVNFLGLGSIISFKTSIKLWSSLVSILVFFATVNIWLSCLGVFGILLATISAVLSSLLVEAYMSHKASAVSWPYKIIILSSFSVILFVLLSTYLIHNNMLDTLYLISLVAVLITSVVVCRVIQSSRKNIAA